MNNKELINSISKLLLEHIADANSHIAPDTRLGEDLHLIGDDAAEFLACFSKQFNVDLSELSFNDYFPNEASSEMHYYFDRIATHKNQNIFMKLYRMASGYFWKIFCQKTSFKTIRVSDLYESAHHGKWIYKQ